MSVAKIFAGVFAGALVLCCSVTSARPVDRQSAAVGQAENVFGVEWYMAALLTMLAGFAGGVFDGGDGAPVSP